ncbi:MAG: serine--tRNA ligase [candidate division WS1 bacterium]|nr:serine--tRNA ligase [candidate division WS1 bacterium]
MIDRALLRDNPDLIRENLRKRHMDYDLDTLLALEARRRELLQVENLRAQRNDLSKQIGQIIREGGNAEKLKTQVHALAEEIANQEQELGEVETRFEGMMAALPNILHPEVPEGESEEQNVELHRWGESRSFEFEPKPHWELGEALGILDWERAAKMASARFVMDLGAGAALERALINLMLDTHTRKHGYTEVSPPLLNNERSAFGIGVLPKFEEDLFKTREGLYLVPTAEMPLTNIHQDEILEGEKLPLCYTAYTPCFRSEAGAAGRESRGLIRLHQFHKVELMKYVRPEQADAELEKLLRNAETILEMLEIPYRRMALCSGDMGFQPRQTFDLEAWMPGMGKYVEISSCSQYGDFQARRAGIRFRPEPEAKPEYVHTMNGSGLACGRTVAAILENYQTEQGTVVVPEALRPYMGGLPEILPRLP